MAYIGEVNRSPVSGSCIAITNDPFEQARELYRNYHRFPAAKVIRIAFPRTVPRVLVRLGELRGLIYSSDRGSPGSPKSYVHFLKTRQLLHKILRMSILE